MSGLKISEKRFNDCILPEDDRKPTVIKQSELNAMTRAQLEALLKKVQKTLDGRSDSARKAKALVQVTKLAKKHGFSLDDLVTAGNGRRKPGRKRRSAAGRKVPPKYQDPNDPSLKWSGRGRNPKWVDAALASGLTMEDLKIG